jgi:hypothetical protein
MNSLIHSSPIREKPMKNNTICLVCYKLRCDKPFDGSSNIPQCKKYQDAHNHIKDVEVLENCQCDMCDDIFGDDNLPIVY